MDGRAFVKSKPAAYAKYPVARQTTNDSVVTLTVTLTFLHEDMHPRS